jgi:hypothetical protein
MSVGRFRSRSLLTKAASLLVLGVFALMIGGPSARSAADSKDVRVVNDATQPVPVAPQGTTAIAGTVGIDPSANGVVVTNSQPLPVAPQATQIEPVREERIFNLAADTPSDQQTLLIVPDGKRLIIEYVSVDSLGSNEFDSRARIAIISFDAGTDRITIPLTPQVRGAVGAQEVTLYADAGDTVVAEFSHADTSTDRLALFTIVGQLLDVPA